MQNLFEIVSWINKKHLYIFMNRYNLGAFTKLLKAIISFVMPVCLSVIPHAKIRLPLDPLNAELNPICHLLALLGGATIVVVSRLRVKGVL